MLKFFTEKDTRKSVAVNQNNVKYVLDFGLGPKIVFVDGEYIIVADSYLDTVARLNESTNY
jgi:hypothetical protein